MLLIFRILLVAFFFTFICIFGSIYCLFSPRNPSHAAVLSRFFRYMSLIFGIKVEVRRSLKNKLPKNCIYISNHQNNYDMFTLTYAVQPRTITVGKKSLLWIPLFGLLYWLTGNFFIDRSNMIKSYNDIVRIACNVKKNDMSLWIFPEGTRSRGRGLLPFKTSAFYAAIVAGLPIVPVCVSNIINKIKLNRWYNGLIIIEILSPVEMHGYDINQVRLVTNFFYDLMKIKIDELNAEIIMRKI